MASSDLGSKVSTLCIEATSLSEQALATFSAGRKRDGARLALHGTLRAFNAAALGSTELSRVCETAPWSAASMQRAQIKDACELLSTALIALASATGLTLKLTETGTGELASTSAQRRTANLDDRVLSEVQRLGHQLASEAHVVNLGDALRTLRRTGTHFFQRMESGVAESGTRNLKAFDQAACAALDAACFAYNLLEWGPSVDPRLFAG